MAIAWQPPSPTYYYEGIGYYRLLVIAGEWGDPPPVGTVDVDYEVVTLLPNQLVATKRLIVVGTESDGTGSFWFEDI